MSIHRNPSAGRSTARLANLATLATLLGSVTGCQIKDAAFFNPLTTEQVVERIDRYDRVD